MNIIIFAAYHKSCRQCDSKAKNHLIFSKNFNSTAKNRNFCKIWVTDAGYLRFNFFYFVTVISTFSTAYLCFFCNKCISSSTFVHDKSFNCSNSLSYGVTHSLISLNKSCDDKASQINIFTNKLNNSDSTTLLWTFLLILILNQSYHQTQIASWSTNQFSPPIHCIISFQLFVLSVAW